MRTVAAQSIIRHSLILRFYFGNNCSQKFSIIIPSITNIYCLPLEKQPHRVIWHCCSLLQFFCHTGSYFAISLLYTPKFSDVMRSIIPHMYMSYFTNIRSTSIIQRFILLTLFLCEYNCSQKFSIIIPSITNNIYSLIFGKIVARSNWALLLSASVFLS